MAILKVDTISGIGTEGPVFEGDIEFTSQNFLTLPKGDTSQRGRGRGLFNGGRVGNTIQFINIQSQGNSIDFGDDTGAAETIEGFGLSSSTRAVFGGGLSHNAKMEFVTIATTGNTASFGNLTVGRRSGCGMSNQTRGVIAGGLVTPAAQNVMDFITIATTANATDFGDLTTATAEPAGLASPTRGIIAGGGTGGGGATNTIEFITIQSQGVNASDFGDLTVVVFGAAGASSETRGLIMAGYRSNSIAVTTDFITIASEGNAIDFGDVTQARGYHAGVSNSTRGVSAGGNANPVALNSNVIDFFDIATTGNANDFGDLLVATRVIHGASDSHGGLTE